MTKFRRPPANFLWTTAVVLMYLQVIGCGDGAAEEDEAMAKRNWDVVVVVPGRTNNDGSETPAAFFSARREDSETGSRRLAEIKEIAPPVLAKRARVAR
jgi:hypothetical protein